MRKLRKGICEICGKVFMHRYASPKYCSAKCFGISHQAWSPNENTKKKMSQAKLKQPVRYWLGKKRTDMINNKFAVGNKSNKTSFKHGENMGADHFNWKGGKQNNQGYVMVLNRSHPFCDHHGYVFEHRLVMEKHIGRYLDKKERIHHINGIKFDNRIENLMLFESESKHQAFHHAENTKLKT